MLNWRRKVSPAAAQPGREAPVLPAGVTHAVLGTGVLEVPAGPEVTHLGLGCFWGAEKLFWQTPGVTNTAVGYAGGFTPNPTYEEVCSGRTGHTEVVRVCFDPEQVSFRQILHLFFENHDPTQGMRQGNDVGSQYRSAIYPVSDAQETVAHRVRDQFELAFKEAGYGPITTEITAGVEFYPAEGFHQQYLHKNPFGYCPVHATGVRCS